MDLPILSLAVGAAAGAAVAYALKKSPLLGLALGAGGALVADQLLQSRSRVARVAPTAPAVAAGQGPRLKLNRPMMTLVARRQAGGGAAATPQQQPSASSQPAAADQGSQDTDAATWSDWGQQVTAEDQMAWVGNEALDPVARAIYSVDFGRWQ